MLLLPHWRSEARRPLGRHAAPGNRNSDPLNVAGLHGSAGGHRSAACPAGRPTLLSGGDGCGRLKGVGGNDGSGGACEVNERQGATGRRSWARDRGVNLGVLARVWLATAVLLLAVALEVSGAAET